MKKNFYILCLLFVSLVFASCGPKPFNGFKLGCETCVEPGTSNDVTVSYFVDDQLDTSKLIALEITDDFTGGASISETSIANGGTVILSVGNNEDGYLKLHCTCNSVSETFWFVVNHGNVIRSSDRPIGYASVNAKANFGGYGNQEVTVTNRTDLMKYAKNGNVVIYIQGKIDMTDEGNGTMLPSTGGGTTDALDAWVNKQTSGQYKTYPDYKTAYGKACTASTEDTSSGGSKQSSMYSVMSKLNNAYKNVIQLKVASNTTIIGLGTDAEISGGSISIANVSNIAIRNVTVSDGYDPFPHHEENDGFNSQHDAIGIQGTTSNIWIDHCTLRDTLLLSQAANGEKYQTYDGLCDIKQSASYITVSNCKLMNHDKTMLICSGSSDTAWKTITLCRNYYYNLGQRQPLVGYSMIHIYNNYYAYDGKAPYKYQATIAARYDFKLIVENNNFGYGGISSSTNPVGICFTSGNTGGSNALGASEKKPFDIPYPYGLLSAANAKAKCLENSGAGKVTVEKND